MTKPSTSKRVPSNLEECFDELKKMLSAEQLTKFRAQPPESQGIEYHTSLGRWIRNNWGLYQGSELMKYFANLGLNHPDDMSSVILDSFWRHLNGVDIHLEEQMEFYKGYWTRKGQERDEYLRENWQKTHKKRACGARS